MLKKANLVAVQNGYQAAAYEMSGLWFHRLHSQPWLRWSPRWPTAPDPPEKHGKGTFVQDNWLHNKPHLLRLIYAEQWIDNAADGGARRCMCTSLDCRMLRSGIHKVPTMVSQIRPLFHTSTVRPRSRRFISLRRGNNKLTGGKKTGEMQQNNNTGRAEL